MRAKYIPLLMLLCIVPLAFDYKSTDDGSGHIFQIVLVIPVLICAILISLAGPRFHVSSAARTISNFSILLVVLGSVVPQIIHGNDIGNYLRVLLAFILFMVGWYAGCHPWSESRLNTFDRIIFAGLAVSTVASFFYGLTSGSSIDEVRYRVVSPVLLGFQGFLLYDIIIKRSLEKVTVAYFVFTLIIELLSITRSLLVGTVLLFCAAVWISSSGLSYFFKYVSRTIVVGVCFVVLIGGVAAFVSPSILSHWSQRIFFSRTTVNGVDPTTLSRIAEIANQYDQVTSNATNLIFGMGFGHEFHFSQQYFYELRATGVFSADALNGANAWEAGHNFWIYQLFSGGLAFGVAFPFALLFFSYLSAARYRAERKRMGDSYVLDSLGRYLMVTFGMIFTTIGGNPLGPRYGGLIYGISYGLMLAAYVRLSKRRVN